MAFIGEAIYVGDPMWLEDTGNEERYVSYGQTGDVVKDWNNYYFEPHNDEPDPMHIGRVLINPERDIYGLVCYQPERVSVRTPEEWEYA